MNQEKLKQRLIELIASKVCDEYSPTCDEWQPHDCGKCYANNCHIADIADHLIANGVTIRERGEWIKTGLGISERVVCSQCGSERGSFMSPPFCNQCGADMRGDAE